MLLEQKQYLVQENLAKLTCTFQLLECIILLLCGKVAFCIFCLGTDRHTDTDQPEISQQLLVVALRVMHVFPEMFKSLSV